MAVQYYSVLTDVSTLLLKGKLCMYYILTLIPGMIKLKVKLTFILEVPKADVQGIKIAIEDSFYSLGILPSEQYSKLIRFGADGASVNSGNKNGVKALLECNSQVRTYIKRCIGLDSISES